MSIEASIVWKSLDFVECLRSSFRYLSFLTNRVKRLPLTRQKPSARRRLTRETGSMPVGQLGGPQHADMGDIMIHTPLTRVEIDNLDRFETASRV